jgi:hypothetical protein
MQLLLTTKRHFTVALWTPFKTIRNFPGIFERMRRAMLRRALNLMEDILSSYYKCGLSAVAKKVNVSGHMLIRILFSFFSV